MTECDYETVRVKLLSEIERFKAIDETEKIYGEHWQVHDWRLRRSHAAGKLCLLMVYLERLELKANRRPHSIGARKARQKAKAARRELRNLERLISEPFSLYAVTEPEYVSPYPRIVILNSKCRIKIYDKDLERPMPAPAIRPEPEPVSGS